MRLSLACQSAGWMPARRSSRSRLSGARPRSAARTSSSLAPISALAARKAGLTSDCAATPQQPRRYRLTFENCKKGD